MPPRRALQGPTAGLALLVGALPVSWATPAGRSDQRPAGAWSHAPPPWPAEIPVVDLPGPPPSSPPQPVATGPIVAQAASPAVVVTAPSEGWRGLIGALWGPQSPTALAVVWCESRDEPRAYNATSGATGLFQILGGPIDALANVRAAFEMWRERGWQPWAASEACWG